ncbi:MAG: hypothetical protein J1E31_03285 [Helicobacter sp.]|nr:hypothetical protein [Helicobacter sp.]
MNISFSGNNALVFVGDRVTMRGKTDIRTNGLLFVGQNSTFNSIMILLHEGKNIIFGNDCMFSWNIWLRNGDAHMIYDSKTHQRTNFSKSIYIGDHIWYGQEVAILKGVFVASGSVLGAKSVNSGGMKFSNAIYAGNPAKLIKEGIFWSRESSCDCEQTKQYEFNERKDFIYEFEKEVFLNPILLEQELDKLESALQKLEFVFDYIHNNTHKNRFALFENSDTSECMLYKDESKPAFKTLKFKTIKNPAVFRVKNSLSYRLGQIMISHSKSFKGYLTMPFTLFKCSKEFKQNRTKQKLEGIKIPPLENLIDYKQSLACKNHLSYKLGSALIKAHKAWYKGGYIWLCFEIFKIKRA